MEQPPYPFAKLSMDISWPCPTSLSGNRYTLGFVDHHIGWPEAFAIPDKSAPNIVNILVHKIFPRFGCPCDIVTDNGTENENQVMKEVFSQLNIHHVTTSFYHPHRNAKVERFHRTLHDVLSKMLKDDCTIWDLYLNQAVTAIGFNHNDSTKFSPFFLVVQQRLSATARQHSPAEKEVGRRRTAQNCSAATAQVGLLRCTTTWSRPRTDRPGMQTGEVNKEIFK